MVKLEEVEEDTYPEQPNTFNPEDDEEGWDTDSDSASDISADSETEVYPDESLSDRIYALKDILSPSTRSTLSSLSTNTYGYSAWGLSHGLKLAWQVSTSVLLLVVPFSLVMMEDQMIAAEESQMRMREQGSEMMTGAPGVGGEAER